MAVVVRETAAMAAVRKVAVDLGEAREVVEGKVVVAMAVVDRGEAARGAKAVGLAVAARVEATEAVVRVEGMVAVVMAVATDVAEVLVVAREVAEMARRRRPPERQTRQAALATLMRWVSFAECLTPAEPVGMPPPPPLSARCTVL